MSDVRTAFVDFAGTWQVQGAALAEDDGLETAVVLSLFTDRLAQPEDGAALRRGWWGDAYAIDRGDLVGSRLWLLGREKQTAEVLTRAEQYTNEALQWLVTDGVASQVAVAASWGAQGVLVLAVEVVRSAKPVQRYRFEAFWKGQ